MPFHVELDEEATAVAEVLLPRAQPLAGLIEQYELMALRLQKTAPVLAAQLREQIERLLQSVQRRAV